ncbi:MAG: hypothetical protein AAGI38_21550 [Bacteroidota bacterium]
MPFPKHSLLASITFRYLLAEIIWWVPSVDEMTSIAKFMVQLTLLSSAGVELFKRTRKDKPEEEDDADCK